MKKIFALIFALCFVLCSCKEVVVDSEVVDSAEVTQYKGKNEYNDISLGMTELVQDDNFYYYTDYNSDKFGFLKKDKKSGKITVISEEYFGNMYEYSKYIYFEHVDGDMYVFDREKQKLETKSYLNVFSLKKDDLKYDAMGEYYDINMHMIHDGWLATVRKYMYGETIFSETYLLNYDMTSKEYISMVEDVDFVLDDDVFSLSSKGEILSYNLKTKKHSFVSGEFLGIKEEKSTSLPFFKYLGGGKILAFKDMKMHIINLANGRVEKEIKCDYDWSYPSVTYDKNNIYLMIEEFYEDNPPDSKDYVHDGKSKYRIDAISRSNYETKTIHRTEIEVPYTYVGLVDADDNCLYLRKCGYPDVDDGTSVDEFLTLSKDEKEIKTLFKTTVE